MLRGPLGAPDAETHFSGHETFPLRRLWLRKAYDAVRRNENDGDVFDKDAGIIHFGVGKNMVAAIRHWSKVCRIIDEKAVGRFEVAPLGDFLFEPDAGVDPYLESIASTWLLHWIVASDHQRATTWYYAFNHLNAATFDRETVAAPLRDLCVRLARSRASAATIKRDVEVFVRSYVARVNGGSIDDQVETVLTELNLIREVSARSFEFRRGPKPSLPDGVFAFAVDEFWAMKERHVGGAIGSVAVEELAFEPGSPGRIFKLSEDAVIDRLVRLEQVTDGAFRWSDTAGVRNISRMRDLDRFGVLGRAYEQFYERAAA